MTFASMEAHAAIRTASGDLTDKEADILLDYMVHCHDTGNNTAEWQKNLYSQVYRAITILHERGVTVDTCTVDDIEGTRGAIKKKEYSENYRRQLIQALKSFFLWYSETNPRLNIKKIEAIRIPKAVWKTKKPEDMLTKDEVLTVINACWTTRDKAFVAMLYDGSHRPIELRGLRWNDINEDLDGYFYNVNQKTGYPRRIRMTFAIPYLEMWKRDYPGRPAGGNYVFVTLNKMNGRKEHRPFTKENTDRLMRMLRDRTGIAKLKAGIFRPTRITHDVGDDVPLPYLMMKNWGHLKTSMIDVYTNLSVDYLDQQALRNAGMERVKKDPDLKERAKLQPTVCECGEVCMPGMKWCPECRRPLTEEARQAQYQVKNNSDIDILTIISDFETRKRFIELAKILENEDLGNLAKKLAAQRRA